MNEKEALRKSLEKKIAVDVVLSENPGAAIEKWRGIFKISQSALARKMGIGSSIISDYESGRRKSPGAAMIKKLVDALVLIDEETGGHISREFNGIYSEKNLSDAIISTRELETPRSIKEIAARINGSIFAEKKDLEKNIHGYTIIDSIKAIVEISPNEFAKLHGLTSDKAMVFTNVEHGRSPLVALKVANVKPSVVIFHGIKEFDKLAERIARVERIPIIISSFKNVDELAAALGTI